MEVTKLAAHRRRLFAGAAALAAAFLLRGVLAALARQLLAAAVLMLPCLPLCRPLEKRLPGSASALVSLLALALGVAALVLAVLPPMVRQVQQLGMMLPALADNAASGFQQVTSWLETQGINLGPLRDGLLDKAATLAGRIVSRVAGVAKEAASGVSQLLLSPLLAFYLLRDRRRICAWLTLLLPVSCRSRGVRAAREMRRESAAYLRGQLLISLAVGAMTALVLALLGIPGWLLLGLLMGVMELIPYVGPVIGGAPAVLLALQNGWGHALWTLALLVAVQELEGAVLSPRMVGDATALHPMTVLLLVSAGGMIAGTMGMLLVIPAVVSLRGAMRGWRNGGDEIDGQG